MESCCIGVTAGCYAFTEFLFTFFFLSRFVFVDMYSLLKSVISFCFGVLAKLVLLVLRLN